MNISIKRLLVSFSIYPFFIPILWAQSLDQQVFELTIGYPIVQEQLPENYSYNPIFLTARFPFFKRNKRLRFYVEPQFAYTFPPGNIDAAVEFGSNLGIQYIFWHSDNSRLSVVVGVGPHYTSLETSLQRKGFLFSDNFELGYHQMLTDKWGVTLKGRFRHLSNANLAQPNKGLDNIFGMVGVFWLLGKEK